MGNQLTSVGHAPNIEGLAVEPLKQIVDERGAVLHMLRNDSPLFSRFGEIYFSLVNPGIVKAWKRHREMTQHFAVPVGRIQLVIYDSREHSTSFGRVGVLQLGRPDSYNLVRIPPMVWYGFRGLADHPSLMANCADLPHTRGEDERRPENDPLIPYDWQIKQ